MDNIERASTIDIRKSKSLRCPNTLRSVLKALSDLKLLKFKLTSCSPGMTRDESQHGKLSNSSNMKYDNKVNTKNK